MLSTTYSKNFKVIDICLAVGVIFTVVFDFFRVNADNFEISKKNINLYEFALIVMLLLLLVIQNLASFLKRDYESENLASTENFSKAILIAGIFLSYGLIVHHGYTIIATLLSLFIINFVKRNTKTLIVLTGFATLAALILQLMAYKAGIINDNAYGGYWSRDTLGDTKQRIAFGMGQPNIISPYLLSSWSAIFYMSKSWIKNILLAISSVLTIIVVVGTNSRTLFYVLPFFIFYIISENVVKKKHFWIILSTIFPIMTASSYALGQFNEHFQALNLMLSGRLSLWKLYIENGFMLVGISDGNRALIDSGTPFDNFYLYSLYEYGILPWSFFVVAFAMLFRWIAKTGDGKLLTIVIVYLIYSLSESHITLVTVPFYPLLFAMFYQRRRSFSDAL